MECEKEKKAWIAYLHLESKEEEEEEEEEERREKNGR
jgi:hypothetical protein